MKAAEIAGRLQGFRAGRGYICRCPVPTHGKGRGDRSPSLSICDGAAGILVFCHAGCDARDVLAELRRRGLLDDGPERAQRGPGASKPRHEPIEPSPEALALWRSAAPIHGTIAERYLRARGITILPPPTLRFLREYPHIPGRVHLPALVAALQASDRRIIAVQVTMIDPRGDRKAQVRFARKTFGHMHDGAVRLGPAGEVLGLAEGVETGLSAMQLFDLPVWCALGAGRMHSVMIPDSVRELHVFADRDEAGERAVERTLEAHSHRRVIVRAPTQPHSDFNDAVRAIADEEAA